MDKRTSKKRKEIALIRKSNDLIESSYKFDIWETRFFVSVLAKIGKEDEQFDVYRIKYRDIIKDFGLASNNAYAMLREGARKLLKQTVVLKYEKDGLTRGREMHLIRMIDYLDNDESAYKTEEQEYVDVTIEEELKPFLLQLSKNFTTYDLKSIAKLGVYSIRLYELLKQYETIGKRVLDVEDMKMMFQLESEYPLFANFYQKVIQPAITEINKYSDLSVAKPDKIKDGRKIIALSFKFGKKTKSDSQLSSEETTHEKLSSELTIVSKEMAETVMAQNADAEEIKSDKDKLYLQFEEIVVKNFGVTPSVFFQLVGKHSAEQIEQAIRITRRMRANAQIKSNVSGYFVQALKKGYTDEKEEQEKKKVAEIEKKRLQMEEVERIEAEKKAKQERINQRVYDLTRESQEYALRAIDAIQLNPTYQKYILEKQRQLGRSLELKDYRDDEFLTAGIRAKIVELERDKFEDILG